MKDIGFTHIALPVTDLKKSFEFYYKYAEMETVYERPGILWISDKSRSFIIVLMEFEKVQNPLLPDTHIDVGVHSKAEVDRLCDLAIQDNCMISGTMDYGHPVGYWAFFKDPDDHTLEISFGQEVGLTVQKET